MAAGAERLGLFLQALKFVASHDLAYFVMKLGAIDSESGDGLCVKAERVPELGVLVLNGKPQQRTRRTKLECDFRLDRRFLDALVANDDAIAPFGDQLPTAPAKLHLGVQARDVRIVDFDVTIALATDRDVMPSAKTPAFNDSARCGVQQLHEHLQRGHTSRSE